jgi:predicted Zn-dependent protease
VTGIAKVEELGPGPNLPVTSHGDLIVTLIANLERLLENGRDDALLRYSLGNAYLKAGDAERSVVNLARAVEQDPGYSAAWKLYGKALSDCGRLREALAAFDQGIAAAQGKGDIQAAKEMQVFRRRVERQLTS